MEVRPVVMRQELMSTYREIETQIEEVKKESAAMAISPHKLRDSTGSWALIPLLAARAQILHALALLNQKGN